MQLDPIKFTSKAPGTNRLKPNTEELLSKFAFKFNLRRYNMAALAGQAVRLTPSPAADNLEVAVLAGGVDSLGGGGGGGGDGGEAAAGQAIVIRRREFQVG